ncbi:MAG TPA: single-stranded DNA-binding protein [Pyrinomonadaceae bacterium]|nr:single-stranded DNA-binding protein [Pyrinomonadaceae bacterium]
MSFNKIIIVGNLGRDPELRYTPQGTAVCNFSVATTEKRRDKSGEYQDVTTWFRVTLWDKKAEVAAKYLQKGKPVYIEGRLKLDEWTDRDGNNRYTLDVTATDMQFIGSASDRDSGYASDSGDMEMPSEPASSSSTAAATAPAADDDIPF